MKIKQIVESLRHLDSRAVDQLVNELVATGRFERSEKYSPFSMFLLPDGSFLNAVDIWGSPIQQPGHTMLNRDQMHSEVYDILRNTDKRIRMIGDEDNDDRPMPMYGHPSNDPEIARYYNIIYLAAWHMAKYAIVPKGVEPTEAQHAMLRYLYMKKGFSVDTDKQDDYHLMPTRIYRDYARRKFLNESLAVWQSINETMSANKIESILVNHYGEARAAEDTGFITPNGIYLDLGRSRAYNADGTLNLDIDGIKTHDDVEYAFWNPGIEDEPSLRLHELMSKYGYIRADGNNGIQLIIEPTPKQYRAIKQLAAHGLRNNGVFYIDFTFGIFNPKHKNSHAVHGNLASKANDVIDIIKNYFGSTMISESISPDKVKSTLYAHYGTTDYFPDAGFIAPDGDCIDFKRSYGVDEDDNWDPFTEDIEWHADVTDALNHEVDSMQELMQDYGYIRAFGNFGIELISEPTPAQYRTIKAMASSSFKRRGKFYVDIIAYFDDTSVRKENNVFERSHGYTADNVVKFIKQHFNPVK